MRAVECSLTCHVPGGQDRRKSQRMPRPAQLIVAFLGDPRAGVDAIQVQIEYGARKHRHADQRGLRGVANSASDGSGQAEAFSTPLCPSLKQYQEQQIQLLDISQIVSLRTRVKHVGIVFARYVHKTKIPRTNGLG